MPCFQTFIYRVYAMFSIVLMGVRACSSSRSESIPGGGIQAENLARHLSVLASDEFEGRAPATRGEELAVDLFASAGRKFEEVKREAQLQGFRGYVLDATQLSFNFDVARENSAAIRSKNK